MSNRLPPIDDPVIAITWKQAFWAILTITTFATVLSIARDYLSLGVDSSDLDGRHRSGVSVITDYGTGCQYLETPAGAITPRLGVPCKQGDN